MKKEYVLRVYRNDKFIGYIKTYRKFSNAKYRFEKTKNINEAIKFVAEHSCNILRIKLSEFIDKLIFDDSYTFKSHKITDKEIRKSKLYLLNTIVIREGIFKRIIKNE